MLSGIDSISDVTSTGMTLNWTAPTGVTRYDIYNVTSGTPVYYGTAASGNTSYVITGLEPSTNYTWRVRYVNTANITDDNTDDESQSTASPPVFAGAVNISNKTTTSMQINWAHVAAATEYKLYYSSNLNSAITTITAPTAFAVVESLSSGTSYSFVVRAVDSTGGEDTNVVTVTDSTTSVSATFNGWSRVYSVGPRVDFQGNETQKENIILSWKQITNSGGTLSGYDLYYSDAENGSYTKINTSAIADPGGTDISYIVPVEDITPGVDLVPGTVYFFKIEAIISGDAIAMTPSPSAVDNKTIIRVVYPPNNMALVHRWMANENICDQYARGLGDGAGSSDIDNHYRCEFDGLGSTDDGGTSYYDLAKDLIVDNNELGCNFTESACDSHSVGTTTTTDCIGNETPTTIEADQYSVYYDRSHRNDGGNCFIQMSSDTTNPDWVQTYNLAALTEIAYTSTPQIGDDISANLVNLPSINGMTPHQAYTLCESHTVNIDIEGSDTAFRKRTLRKKEWHAASAWPSSISVAAANSLQSGVTAKSCNSKDLTVGTDDLDDTYTEAHWIVDADNNSDSRIQTGTSYTDQCRSMYGIQDMIGNLQEYVSDHVASTGSTEVNMGTSVANYDSAFQADWINGDGNYFRSNTGGNYLFRSYSDANYNFTPTNNNSFNRYINAALGTSLYCASGCSADDKYLSAGSYGVIDNYLSPSFDDRFNLNFNSISTFGFAVGGFREWTTYNGRYTMFSINTTDTSTDGKRYRPKSIVNGTRCMITFPYN